MIDFFPGLGFLGVKGIWNQGQIPCVICNVYSPCSLNEKRTFWKHIKQVKQQMGRDIWCIVGDFNAVRRREERKGRDNAVSNTSGMIEFNKFISEIEVLDM